MGGRFFALLIVAATVVFVVAGTLSPNQAVVGAWDPNAGLMGASASPRDAVSNLLRGIASHKWSTAYDSLANKGEFSQSEFERDLGGSYGSLRTYADLDGYDVKPMHVSSAEATVRANLRW